MKRLTILAAALAALALATPAMAQALTPGQSLPAQKKCTDGCFMIIDYIDDDSVEITVGFTRAGLPKDYLKANGCANARVGKGAYSWGCDPEWVAAIFTLGADYHPQAGSNNTGYWWRRYILATNNFGKFNPDDTKGVVFAFDHTTPGVPQSYDCPEGHSGLEPYTRYRVIVYARPRSGHGDGWNKPLMHVDFMTDRLPEAERNTACG